MHSARSINSYDSLPVGDGPHSVSLATVSGVPSSSNSGCTSPVDSLPGELMLPGRSIDVSFSSSRPGSNAVSRTTSPHQRALVDGIIYESPRADSSGIESSLDSGSGDKQEITTEVHRASTPPQPLPQTSGPATTESATLPEFPHDFSGPPVALPSTSVQVSRLSELWGHDDLPVRPRVVSDFGLRASLAPEPTPQPFPLAAPRSVSWPTRTGGEEALVFAAQEVRFGLNDAMIATVMLVAINYLFGRLHQLSFQNTTRTAASTSLLTTCCYHSLYVLVGRERVIVTVPVICCLML